MSWNQLASDWTLDASATAQDHSPQGYMAGDITGLDFELVADIIHSMLMVWNDSTPGEALRHGSSLLKQQGKSAHVTLM